MKKQFEKQLQTKLNETLKELKSEGYNSFSEKLDAQNPNHKLGPIFKITKNTDSIDINDKCLGLSARRPSIPSDVADHIYSNRGLHIQIRHNKDAQTFAQANSLASLITAAPNMVQLLQRGLECGVFDDAPVFKADVIKQLKQARGAK